MHAELQVVEIYVYNRQFVLHMLACCPQWVSPGGAVESSTGSAAGAFWLR